MTRRLTRALAALAVPTLAATALATPAEAAAGPKVPTVDQVATVYPHLAGGTSAPTSSKVFGPGKNCKPGKAIKGATQTSTTYISADPTAYLTTAAQPLVSVTAMRFRSAGDAIDWLHGTGKNTKKCAGGTPGTPGPKVDVKLKKINFTLGDERQGWTITASMEGMTMVSHSLTVRAGKHIVFAYVSSMEGEPPVKKAINTTALALKTAVKK